MTAYQYQLRARFAALHSDAPLRERLRGSLVSLLHRETDANRAFDHVQLALASGKPVDAATAERAANRQIEATAAILASLRARLAR